MGYDISGSVKLVQDAQTFGSGFTKRAVVITTEDGKYPQDISIDFVQDKVSLLDDIRVGDDVTVAFNLRGNEHNGRYFNNLQGWKLDNRGGGCDAIGSASNPVSAASDALPGIPDEPAEEDIPF
jgi:hypothetical protein